MFETLLLRGADVREQVESLQASTSGYLLPEALSFDDFRTLMAVFGEDPVATRPDTVLSLYTYTVLSLHRHRQAPAPEHRACHAANS